MTTVREDLVKALEATIVGRHIIGCRHGKRRGSTSERYGCPRACALATAALDRARAEPEALLKEAGQARRELGERVKDGE